MPVRIPFFLPRVLALCGGCLSAVSCGRPERVEVTASRPLLADEGEPRTGLTTAQRYASNSAQSMLNWNVPEGWSFLPATQFRHINFDFGSRREGECYLTLLPTSTGGGVLENFNRWRKQMGLEPFKDADVTALPSKTVFGRPVACLDVTGTYTGGSGPMMTPGEAKPDYRMLGIIFEAPGFLFTIKMTGPAALIAQNEGKFDAFCQSLGVAAKVPAG